MYGPIADLDMVVDLLLASYAWNYRLAASQNVDADVLTALMDRQIGVIFAGLAAPRRGGSLGGGQPFGLALSAGGWLSVSAGNHAEAAMITVHHLNESRSQRILWLLEELEVPYEIKF